MNDTQPYIEAKAQTYTERTYTAKEIAFEHGVTDATVRNRWFDWLEKVAPAALLKSGKSYTELAHTLFGEFANVDKQERHAWVADAKSRYASEWGAVGITDCEIMPDNVGNALALIQTNLAASSQALTLELSQLDDFINQLNATDETYSQAEVESWAAAGAKKAVAQFRTEEVAKAQTLNALRQKRMGGEQS